MIGWQVPGHTSQNESLLPCQDKTLASRAGQTLSVLKRYLGCGAPISNIVIREEWHLPSLREVGLRQCEDKDLDACSWARGGCTGKGLTRRPLCPVRRKEEELVKMFFPAESLLCPEAFALLLLPKESPALLAMIWEGIMQVVKRNRMESDQVLHQPLKGFQHQSVYKHGRKEVRRNHSLPPTSTAFGVKKRQVLSGCTYRWLCILCFSWNLQNPNKQKLPMMVWSHRECPLLHLLWLGKFYCHL